LARASAFQAEGCGFDPRFPLHIKRKDWLFRIKLMCFELTKSAHVAQEVEHFLGKEEVSGSSPLVGSMEYVN
jgi:hypothetical protein